MCRALWVIVVGASEEATKHLRRALGPESQVVLVTTDVADPAIRGTEADALVIDGDAPGARELVADMAQTQIAILWVGADAPAEAHHASEQRDELEGSLTKALLARKG